MECELLLECDELGDAEDSLTLEWLDSLLLELTDESLQLDGLLEELDEMLLEEGLLDEELLGTDDDPELSLELEPELLLPSQQRQPMVRYADVSSWKWQTICWLGSRA